MSAVVTPLTAYLRKVVLYQEDVRTENGTAPEWPALRATVAVVMRNPWIGTGPTLDLASHVEAIAPHLAKLVAEKLMEALGGAGAIEAFGKAAIVGTGGEIEHGGAFIHTPYFGNLFREFLQGTSIICFADSRAEAGQLLIVPMWHKTAAATRTHYQTVAARISDGPRADEVVIIAAASTGPRPHARIGDRTTDKTITLDKLENVFA